MSDFELLEFDYSLKNCWFLVRLAQKYLKIKGTIVLKT